MKKEFMTDINKIKFEVYREVARLAFDGQLKGDVSMNLISTLINANVYGSGFDAEKALYESISKIDHNSYADLLQALISINGTVTKFFDDVLVMDKDEKIKNNRLALLNELKNKYIMLTDFSKLSA